MNKIDEIALRVADKYDPRGNYFPYRNDLLLYVKELLAELRNEEKPVAYGWVEDGELKALSFVDIPFKPQYSPAAVKSPLFTHPAPVIASEQKPVGEGYIRDGKIIAVKLKDVELVMRLPEGVTIESLYLHPAPIPEVKDAFPQAHRLALELECLILSCKDTVAVSKWWDSANEALEQWREFNEAARS